MRARRQIVSETYLSVSRRICWANRRERGRGNEYVIGWRAISVAAVSFVVSRDLAKKKHSFLVPFHFPLALVILALIRLDDGPGFCSDLL